MAGLNYRANANARLVSLEQGDVAGAMPSGSNDDVLHNMEAGTIQRIGSQYKNSNQSFQNAQQQINVWASSWRNTTSGKMSTAAASLLLNDNVNDYQAKGFEKSLVATYSAMNQLDLNNLDNARVAIKQMYETEEAIESFNQATYNAERQKQKEIRTNGDKNENALYQKINTEFNFPDLNSPAVLRLRNSYQNAFSHYLAGFVFQALGEPSLSRPGYLKAGQLQPRNALIQQSINNLDNNVMPAAKQTDLLIVQTVGHAPQIKSMQKTLFFNYVSGSRGDRRSCLKQITLFYPKLIIDKDNASRYQYTIDKKSYTPIPMTNVNLMAKRALKDEMPHIILRNVSAVIRDGVLQQMACSNNNGNLALQLGAGLVGVFLNRADERSWTTLPAFININRQKISYGKHMISVTVNGQTYTKTFKLDQPYQLLSYRIINNRVFFQLQQSMGAT